MRVGDDSQPEPIFSPVLMLSSASLKSKTKFIRNPGTREYFSNFGESLPTAVKRSAGDEGWKCYFAWTKFWPISASLNPKKKFILNPETRVQSWQTMSYGGPLRLELVAVGAGPYFNFVSRVILREQ